MVPVLRHRLRARAASCPGRVEPEVPGEVRPGLGQTARGDLRAAKAAGRSRQRGADHRPDIFPAWDSLSENEKKLYARQMEVYAGYQENADYNAGRLLDAVAEMGEADNTLVFFIFGDNGASLEGTVTGSFNEMTMANGIALDARAAALPARPVRRAGRVGDQRLRLASITRLRGRGAGDTLFRWGASRSARTWAVPVTAWWKVAGPDHRRGRPPVAVHPLHRHWLDDPGSGGHPQPQVVDGIEQEPMHGTSFAYTFDQADAAERHTQQYGETYGNRAIYQDGWWGLRAATAPACYATAPTLARFAPGTYDPEKYTWELSTISRTTSPRPGNCPGEPGQARRTQGPVLAGSREVQGAAAAGRPVGLLRDLAADADHYLDDLLRRRGEHRLGWDLPRILRGAPMQSRRSWRSPAAAPRG